MCADIKIKSGLSWWRALSFHCLVDRSIVSCGKDFDRDGHMCVISVVSRPCRKLISCEMILTPLNLPTDQAASFIANKGFLFYFGFPRMKFGLVSI